MREPGKLKRSAWWRQPSRLGRNLLDDRSGAVLPYMAVLIPVMMGLIGLAVDASRLFILDTEQKDLADAAALAGAYELDGEYVSATNNAITRATNAAHNVVTNDPRWANDAEPELHIKSVQFCEDLEGPPHARTCNGYTTDPQEANFIEVVTEFRSVFPSFLVAVGAVAQPQTDAIAIAGSSIVACNVQPLMLCNPMEPNEFAATPGQMFHFKQKKGGGEDWYSPGNFGLVDPPGQHTSTGPELRRLLSQQSPNFCYVNRVSPRPGQAVGNIDDPINVRFDLPVTGNDQGMDLTPAPNVLKGMVSTHPNDKCNFKGNNLSDSPEGRLPRDIDLPTADGTTVGIGSGKMDPDAMDDYWKHHYGTDWPTHHFTTRFGAYMHELGLDGIGPPIVTGPESPKPACSPADAGDYTRRIISVSIVNCQAEGVQGNSETDLRSDKYADFFITEPAAGGEIFTEFVRMLTPEDDDSRLKRIIQLYR